MYKPLAITLGVMTWAASAIAQSTYYVDADANGSADGSSWSDAFVTLLDATLALQPGDTLYSRGTFYETAAINVETVTWIGDSDPSRPTWIRGDRYSDQWQETTMPGVYQLDGIAELINTPLRPGSVVFDYKRDDLVGTVTGVDLSTRFAELPANGAGVYYGHLSKQTSLPELEMTSSAWFWDEANDRVYVHVPEGRAFNAALVGVCINGQNGVSVWKGNVHVTGVNTLCTPGFANNNGYGLKGLGTFGGGVFENADIIDSGWHAAGYEIGSPYNCTLRNLRAWSSGVDGSNANNPFVFYSLTNLPNAGHVGEDLVFHAYPLLGTDGAPIHRVFRPTLGHSHTSSLPNINLGGILWSRCHLINHVPGIETKSGPIDSYGTSISAANVPFFISYNASEYPIVVEDSVFEGAGGVPSSGVRYDRCVFLPGNSRPTSEYRSRTSNAIWLRSCTIELGIAGPNPSSAFFDIASYGRIYLELCTIHANAETPMQNIFRLGGGSVFAWQCVFSTRNATNLMTVWPDRWDTFATAQHFYQCYLAGPITPAANPYGPTRSFDWWKNTIDPGAIAAPTPQFVEPTGTDLGPVLGSELDLARSAEALPELSELVGLDGLRYNQRYGAFQRPCPADVNGDGTVGPADFTAWIAAFNTQAPGCDQNSDSLCTPADFSAWIANFNAGC